MARLEGLPAALLEAHCPVEVPAWLDHRSAWTMHLPFAGWLVATARPRRIVELGVHVGVSYCAFAEAVRREALVCTCLGVDTFAGDDHAGQYDGGVLAGLQAHHDPRYGDFSRLFVGTFDAAVANEPEGGVDLLHIDGLHTYEAVRADYESWLSRMSARGVVLFHDTAVRDRGFGVWQLWAELSAARPHFHFEHGSGLGVLAVGEAVPEGLRPLFDATPEEAIRLREMFHALGARLQDLTPRPPPKRKRRGIWPFRG